MAENYRYPRVMSSRLDRRFRYDFSGFGGVPDGVLPSSVRGTRIFRNVTSRRILVPRIRF